MNIKTHFIFLQLANSYNFYVFRPVSVRAEYKACRVPFLKLSPPKYSQCDIRFFTLQVIVQNSGTTSTPISYRTLDVNEADLH